MGEKHRFVLALEDHVPLEGLAGLARDQRAAPLRRNELEDRVVGVGRMEDTAGICINNKGGVAAVGARICRTDCRKAKDQTCRAGESSPAWMGTTGSVVGIDS